MSRGILTTTRDLGDYFKVLQALQAAEKRKERVIKEFTMCFMRQGISEYRAKYMAETKYNSIHITQPHEQGNY